MHWLDREDGGVGTEYAILGAVLVLAFVGALTMMGTELGSLYESVKDDVIAALN